jgi:hypothetical protein
MARYCNIDEVWAESSCFGGVTAEQVLEQMLVNDGQKHRGFRKSIFNEELRIVGIAAGPHKEAQTVIHIDYAKGVLKEGQQ